MNKFRLSLKLRREALLIREHIGKPGPLSDTYNDIAETYIQVGRLDSVDYYLTRAFKMKKDLGDKEMMSVVAMNYGQFFLLKKKYPQAITWYLIAEKNAIDIGAYSYLSKIYENLAACNASLGRTDNAYDYLKLHEQYKDSVLNLQSQEQLNELNSKFQSEKKSLEIDNLKKEKQQNAILAQEKELRNLLILVFSIIFIVLICIYTFTLFRRIKLIRQQKAMIEAQKIVVEEKQKEVMDSIHYARRIQKSLLPTEKYIDKSIKRLKS